MPYNDERGFFYGEEASRVQDETQARFIAYLAGKLNDPDGPYRGNFQVDVFVSGNSSKGAAAYQKGEPSATVLQGKATGERWDQNIDQTSYKGMRRELSLELDCAAGKEVAEDAPPADETAADNQLASFIEEIVSDGYDDLWSLGLTEIEIESDAEKQRAGEGRNPMMVSYASYSLSDYS